MDSIALRTAKDTLSSLVDRVAGTHERVTITRNGQPAAVLISPDDLDSLEQTLEILSDPEAMSRLRRGQREIAEGDIVDEAELRRMLDARREQ